MNTLNRLLILLVLVGSITACKSKKKVADISGKDQNQTEAMTDDDDEMEENEDDYEDDEEKGVAVMDRKTVEKTESKLENYFAAIASARSVEAANKSIEEALSLFASPSTSVLIIIYKSGNDVDYDKPTTIKDYLNYLKDQKKNDNKIEDLTYNSSGKITAIELIRKKL